MVIIIYATRSLVWQWYINCLWGEFDATRCLVLLYEFEKSYVCLVLYVCSGMTLNTLKTNKFTWTAFVWLHKALRRILTEGNWKIWLPSISLWGILFITCRCMHHWWWSKQLFVAVEFACNTVDKLNNCMLL